MYYLTALILFNILCIIYLIKTLRDIRNNEIKKKEEEKRINYLSSEIDKMVKNILVDRFKDPWKNIDTDKEIK